MPVFAQTVTYGEWSVQDQQGSEKLYLSLMWSVVNLKIYCTVVKQLANHAHAYNYSVVTIKLQEQQQV